MARRSKDEAEVTKENIVKAAIRLFLRDGVAHTTLEKIAAEAGYTRGAVYHHFENKSKLLTELKDRSHPPAQAMFNSMKLEESNDPLETLKNEITKALNNILNDETARQIHTIFIFNCEFIERENPAYLQECKYSDAALNRTVEYLEKARKLGQLRSNLGPQSIAAMLIAFCFGLISFSLRVTSNQCPRDWNIAGKVDCGEALDVFFRGLRN
jgi:AcrR family transcriptional regulator